MKIIKTIPSLPKRRPDTHKGDYGKALIVAGSRSMTGAAALCSEAALRTGAGLVYLATPASQQPILAGKLTETITYALPETPDGTLSDKALDRIINLAQGINVAAIGPGISRHPQTVEIVNSLVPHLHCPVIIDADGLNALSTAHRSVVKKQRAEMILTPHSGEMARLLKTTPTRIEANRVDSAIEASKRFNAIVALKGYQTVVTDGERVYINKTGNPGMATAGSGDVLTGMLAGLVAQLSATNLTIFESVILAVHLHGKAGDLAAKELGEYSLVAGDIIKYLPKAFK